jgi:CheY-like chemotaxis protein
MDQFEPATILLVEDDAGDQKLIRQSLRKERIANELIIVNSADEAMEYLNRTKQSDVQCPLPDLILLDLNMPGMEGKTFLKSIKDDAELDVIPVVILTTSDSERDILESFKLQASGYIRKPVTLDEFQRVIEDLTDYWFVICKHIERDKERKNDRNLCAADR